MGWRDPSRCSKPPCSRPRRARAPSSGRRPWCGKRRAPAAARGRGPAHPRIRCPDRGDGRRCATCASALPRRAPCGARSCRRRWTCRRRCRARRWSECGAHPSRPTRSTDPRAPPRARLPHDPSGHRRRAPRTRRRRWSSRSRRRRPPRNRSVDLRQLRPPPRGGCRPVRCVGSEAAGRPPGRSAAPRSRSRERGSPLPGEASAMWFSGPCSSSSPRCVTGACQHHTALAFRLASEPETMAVEHGEACLPQLPGHIILTD